MTLIRACLVVLLALLGTVSTSPYCDGALMAQAQGQSPVEPSMPPPGNPDHAEPPPGAFCSRSPKPEHSCKCHATCVENEDGTIAIQEDGAHCRAYCYKKACHCPVDGCQSAHEAQR